MDDKTNANNETEVQENDNPLSSSVNDSINNSNETDGVNVQEQEQNTDSQNQNTDNSIPENNNEYEEDPTGEHTTFRIVRDVSDEYEVRPKKKKKKKIIIGSIIGAVLLIIAAILVVPQVYKAKVIYPTSAKCLKGLNIQSEIKKSKINSIWYNHKDNIMFVDFINDEKDQDYAAYIINDDECLLGSIYIQLRQLKVLSLLANDKQVQAEVYYDYYMRDHTDVFENAIDTYDDDSKGFKKKYINVYDKDSNNNNKISELINTYK